MKRAFIRLESFLKAWVADVLAKEDFHKFVVPGKGKRSGVCIYARKKG